MKIGFTCGAFDLLHAGHVAMLRECSSQCDVLIVGLHTDPSIERSSKNKPIQSVYERTLQLEGCKYVSKIIPYDTEDDLVNLLATENIDIRFVGEEYKDTVLTGHDVCDRRGIEIYYTSRKHDYSSSDLIKRIGARNSDFLCRNPYFTYMYHLANFARSAKDGLFLEFGVYKGHSLNIIARNTKNKVYGFDSFKGLPEAWQGKFGQGSLACEIPTNLPSNVELIVGYFEETLEKFLEEHTDPITFIHIDCDIYSATKYILDKCHDRIADQCIIAFDDYNNYPEYQEHEWKAWSEYVVEKQVTNAFMYQYGLHQAAFRVVKNPEKNIEQIILTDTRDQFDLKFL